MIILVNTLNIFDVSDRHDIEKEVMQLRKENVNLEALLNNKTDENVEIQKEVINN